MATNFNFTVATNLGDIKICGQSIGAHLAAKLEVFGSDERTLTDELCDMLCIWLNNQPQSNQPLIHINLGKTTPNEEARNGADLRLTIRTPDGIKDCLFQAKVLDPHSGKLRCANPKGLNKLREQLEKAQSTCGNLAFLLVYVPSQYLDGSNYGYSTYEQYFCTQTAPGLTSALGATVIPVSSLISPSGAWLDPNDPVPNSNGSFTNGIAFWKVLMELLVCRRGDWSQNTTKQIPSSDEKIENFIQLVVEAESSVQWAQLGDLAGEFLDHES